MDDSGWQIERVVIIAQNWNERALIAAQLQEESVCRVESAGDLEVGLAQLILRAALIILDWSDQNVTSELWSKFQAAARGAPILVLARRIDHEELEKLGVNSASVLFRPLTVGQVVQRAREALKEARSYDGTDVSEQAAH
jgi:DNA-binding response OmpR family regulator